ncbi:MAG TPA: hypothetical protein VN661_10985 [Candidatus Acidoferrales bacterium]|nr:hypothetical protein [Candidatus Acidoferrales bacterium]
MCVRSLLSASSRAPRWARFFAVVIAISCAGLLWAAQNDSGPLKVDPSVLAGLHWRSIGPAVFGGRVVDVAGVPGNPNIIYVAHSSGGLWKSTNGGTTFQSVFNDGNTLALGAIALDPRNPNVVYAGTGEGTIRNTASYGDGIYKTLDGGATWKHLGLEKTERFARIVVNPANPQIVYAAAMGHEFGPNRERGLYRSSDGGATWKQILYVNETTGASDVALDPKNPNIVFAGMYDYMRQPWYFRSGGPGSGLYRSDNGGDTWTKLTDPSLHNGLPTGAENDLIGRIGLSICGGNPKIVYALIQSRKGVLWRSDDGGNNWRMINDNHRINTRPFYFSQVRVDPADANRVYVLAVDPQISDDGGKTFRAIPYGIWFGDAHAMWIDPTNPSRLLGGSDGGFFSSNDRGATWDFHNNMPMAQAYHVWLDMADPYHVLGGFQDHEMWRGPSDRWNDTGARAGDWRRMRGHADGTFIVADPRDPNIVYYVGQGDMTRFNWRTHEERYIQPYPVASAGTGDNMLKYRFNWNAPILMSKFNPDVIYHGANVVFKTTDGGDSWTKISRDLTTDNKQEEKLSGGPITPDNSTAEFHCTIVSLAESQFDPKTLWAGSDDGNVQVTHDGGAHWTNVVGNIQGLPKESWVSSINTSYADRNTVYVSFDRHTMDDFAPYAYVSHDDGKTWKRISGGLSGYVHIVKPDPRQPNLIYAGTELGFYASFDGGENWTDLRLGLPHLPVYDLQVHPRDNDLVIATHGRGFYILDDATPLQQLAQAISRKTMLFPPARGTRYNRWADTSTLGSQMWTAQNRPYGSLISYYLAQPAPGNRVRISILNAQGKTIRTLEGPGAAGVNRAVWNLQEDPLLGIAPDPRKAWPDRALQGVRVLAGVYTVRLEVAGRTLEGKATVRLNPNVHTTAADMQQNYNAVKRLARMSYQMDESLERIRRIDAHLADLQQSASDASIAQEAAQVRKSLAAVRVDMQPDWQDPEHLNLRTKVRELLTQVNDYSGKPTQPQLEYIGVFDGQLQGVLTRLNGVISGPLARLNSRLAAAHAPYISPEPTLAATGGTAAAR